LFSLFFMFFTAVVIPKMPVKYCAEDGFAQQTLFYRIIYYNVAVTLARFKYYSAWVLGQAAMNASGISFNGYDDKGNSKWDKIVAANPKLELIGDPRTKIEFWNTYTQVWLRRYIYLRIAPEKENNSPQRVNFASYATMVASAFWHGFYPGYYFAFIQLAFVVNIAKYIFRAGDKFRFIPAPIQEIIRQIATNIVFNYLGGGFLLLSIENVLNFYRNINYIPTIMIFTAFFFFALTGFGQKAKGKRTPGEKVKTG